MREGRVQVCGRMKGGGGRGEKGSKLTYVLFRIFGARERAAETVGG